MNIDQMDGFDLYLQPPHKTTTQEWPANSQIMLDRWATENIENCTIVRYDDYNEAKGIRLTKNDSSLRATLKSKSLTNIRTIYLYLEFSASNAFGDFLEIHTPQHQITGGSSKLLSLSAVKQSSTVADLKISLFSRNASGATSHIFNSPYTLDYTKKNTIEILYQFDGNSTSIAYYVNKQFDEVTSIPLYADDNHDVSLSDFYMQLYSGTTDVIGTDDYFEFDNVYLETGIAGDIDAAFKGGVQLKPIHFTPGLTRNWKLGPSRVLRKNGFAMSYNDNLDSWSRTSLMYLSYSNTSAGTPYKVQLSMKFEDVDLKSTAVISEAYLNLYQSVRGNELGSPSIYVDIALDDTFTDQPVTNGNDVYHANAKYRVTRDLPVGINGWMKVDIKSLIKSAIADVKWKSGTGVPDVLNNLTITIQAKEFPSRISVAGFAGDFHSSPTPYLEVHYATPNSDRYIDEDYNEEGIWGELTEDHEFNLVDPGAKNLMGVSFITRVRHLTTNSAGLSVNMTDLVQTENFSHSFLKTTGEEQTEIKRILSPGTLLTGDLTDIVNTISHE